MTLPIIDIGPLLRGDDAAARATIAPAIAAACRATGFFYVRGHDVTEAMLARLDAASRRFFALPRAAKQAIAMERGGRAWRGWFPLEG
jgi:isopenicillin N synthase-like dioxygenase